MISIMQIIDCDINQYVSDIDWLLLVQLLKMFGVNGGCFKENYSSFCPSKESLIEKVFYASSYMSITSEKKGTILIIVSIINLQEIMI